jgi:hypothetical protein
MPAVKFFSALNLNKFPKNLNIELKETIFYFRGEFVKNWDRLIQKIYSVNPKTDPIGAFEDAEKNC